MIFFKTGRKSIIIDRYLQAIPHFFKRRAMQAVTTLSFCLYRIRSKRKRASFLKNVTFEDYGSGAPFICFRTAGSGRTFRPFACLPGTGGVDSGCFRHFQCDILIQKVVTDLAL